MAAFFKCWTRKEAFIKVIGLGLSQPLDKFDVTLVPEQPAALLWVSDDDASRWSLYDLEVGGDYAGALAVEGQVSSIRCWHMTSRMNHAAHDGKLCTSIRFAA